MKITIVGAGNVGASTCFLLASKNICSDIVLMDVYEDIATGKAIDISQSCRALGIKTVVNSQKDYSYTKDSDIVVITAGSPRKEGMTREDLLNINSKIISSVVSEVKKYSPNAILIIVSNPLDVMTYVALKKSGFDKKRVIGMGGVLDSARMSNVISSKLKHQYNQIDSLVIGAHGETMIPLARFSLVDEKKLELIFNDEDLEEIIDKTKNGGAEIVKRLGTSAYYAPAASVSVLVEAIVKDKRTIHPCSVLLEGEYGCKDICIGVPVVLGKNGVEEIVELPLNNKEYDNFNNSVASIKSMLSVLKI